MPDALAVPLLVLIGLAVGSFLNVCIHRLPRRESIVTPSSRCPACGHRLPWYENLPLVSYAVLRGRCRACRAPISPRYPLVEAATAGLFVLHYAVLGWEPLLAVRLLLVSALIVLFAIDLEHQLLPNSITIPGILVGFLSSFVLEPGWLDSLLGILVGGGALLIVIEIGFRLFKVEAMGMGDLKMLAMIGAFLGWQLTILTAVLASVFGGIAALWILFHRPRGPGYVIGLLGIVSLLLIGTVGAQLMVQLAGMIALLLWLLVLIRSRVLRGLVVPFGTFLAAAAVVASLAGEELLAWYLRWLRWY